MENFPHNAVMRRISDLQPYRGNARLHSRKQIAQIATSIQRFGFTNPVLVSPPNDIIAGHGRVAAAKLLGWTQVPTLEIGNLTPAEVRAYILADNKLAVNASWDADILAIEFQGLIELDFDLSLTGFTTTEIDITLDGARDRSTKLIASGEDFVPQSAFPTVTRFGDTWQLGNHQVTCGDARKMEAFQVLFNDRPADCSPSAPMAQI